MSSRKVRISVLAHSLLVGTCLVLGSAVASAAAYPCTGTVTQVAVGPNGTVAASFLFPTGNMSSETVCNVDTALLGISPTTCKSMLAVLTAAKLAERSVTLWFDNTSSSSCSLTAWTNLHDFGWYWGPMLD